MKWRNPSNLAGVPVWSHAGFICTGETYKDKVKFTFIKGASLADPSGLFNSSLEGNTRRAIDIHEGEKVNARRFQALVKAAVAQNGPSAKKTKSLSQNRPPAQRRGQAHIAPKTPQNEPVPERSGIRAT